jgi:hypothetical protein
MVWRYASTFSAVEVHVYQELQKRAISTPARMCLDWQIDL